MINVSSRPEMVIPVNCFRKTFSKNSIPRLAITLVLTMYADTNGITTNKTTDIIKVFQGMAIPETPSNKVTIGINATTIIKSLMATCTSV
ncbi:hypothetical protein SDC9_206454 [bioreactor metagenome]|uniref:Uncharacterized protein n=1 Tax=bioreactor metagenome TaxID=1076179 RepID=A0A645J541_9ZZZZ